MAAFSAPVRGLEFQRPSPGSASCESSSRRRRCARRDRAARASSPSGSAPPRARPASSRLEVRDPAARPAASARARRARRARVHHEAGEQDEGEQQRHDAHHACAIRQQQLRREQPVLGESSAGVRKGALSTVIWSPRSSSKPTACLARFVEQRRGTRRPRPRRVGAPAPRRTGSATSTAIESRSIRPIGVTRRRLTVLLIS